MECSLCGGKENLKRCNRCKIVSYCCVQHQKEDWPSHKLSCKEPVAERNQGPNLESIYRLYREEIRQNPSIFLMHPEEIQQLNGRRPLVQEVEIPGLLILHNFLSDQEHDELADMASREKQHAGVDRTKGRYAHSMSTYQFIPSVGLYYYLSRIAGRLIQLKAIPHMPHQLTINYYEPNEGLQPHTDNVDVIREYGVGISLLSSCVIDFTSKSDLSVTKQYPLFPGSVMIQAGSVRYEWLHGIEPDNIHTFGGVKIERGPRISLQLSDFDRNYFSSKEALALKNSNVPRDDHPY